MMSNKRYSINIKATDYQKIYKISDDNIETIGFTWKELFMNADGADSLGMLIAQTALEIMLNKAIKDNNGITVGKSETRNKREAEKRNKRKANTEGNNNSLELIASFDKETIGGIVGALSGTVSLEEIRKAHKITEKISLDNNISFYINLQVHSRMDSNDSWYFLHTLLNHGKLKSHSSSVFENMDQLYDFLLVDLFADSIKKAIPKGHYRTYQRFERNDDRLKGTIDIARHIKLNAGKENGAIAYSFRENSVDNRFNRLLLSAYKHLKERYPQLVEEKIDKDIAIRDYINVLLFQIEHSRLDVHKIIIENATPISHPYYTEYEETRKICLRILRNIGMSIFDATSGQVRGFLYYLPDIWEDFLMYEMQRRYMDRYKILAQEPYEYVKTLKGKYICTSIPDFVFLHNNIPVLILDAKFKPGWSDNSVSKKANDIDKCIRDMVVVKAKGTGIIYPFKLDLGKNVKKLEDRQKGRKRTISDNNDIYFYFFPVGIPLSNQFESYDEWRAKFDYYLNIFLETLEKDLEECCGE